jgi:phosphoadenosine phosphosulfate reductase
VGVYTDEGDGTVEQKNVSAEILGPLFDGNDKVALALERIKQFEPPGGYCLKFSGGKDSVCIYALAKMAGVKFTAIYNWTTVDPPPLYRFIRDEYPDVIISRPPKTMWQLIEEKGLPTRMRRWCCQYLKHRDVRGDLVMTGVRASESPKRKRSGVVELCRQDPSQRLIHPIVDWEDHDVWHFIRSNNIKFPPLYTNRVKRLGCIGCPLGSMMREELELYPKIAGAYRRAAGRFLKRMQDKGKEFKWKTGDEYYNWWIGEAPEDTNDDQYELYA